MAVLQLLLLLIIANGAPILAQYLFREHGNLAIDGGHCFRDGRPLFGATKTWRGLIAALILTTLTALTLGMDPLTGFLVGLLALCGDLLSSFTKRRLGYAPSSMALGLDQIPEALLPTLAVAAHLALSAGNVVMVVTLFFLIELGLSRLLYRLGIRKQPY